MNFQDKAENKFQEVAGKAKEFVGEKSGDQELQGEGAADQAGAGAKQATENVKDAAKNLKDGLGGN
ncbi:CsbD family protein [Dietzia sp.]|uniref:CsbD family protein n=1 Tax=Dietzia sp. TaxID=1871616 RepID=UPI002FD8CF84